MDTRDLRVLFGSAGYAHCGTTYRHQNADDLAIERLVAITGGIKVSAHVRPWTATIGKTLLSAWAVGGI